MSHNRDHFYVKNMNDYWDHNFSSLTLDECFSEFLVLLELQTTYDESLESILFQYHNFKEPFSIASEEALNIYGRFCSLFLMKMINFFHFY